METPPVCFIYFSGAGSEGEPNLSILTSKLGLAVPFSIVSYPGWQRYIKEDFCAEVLIAEMTVEIVRRFPQGPICLVGRSIGGHVGYATALRLQEQNRTVALLCSIDSFVASSNRPGSDWKKRALTDFCQVVRGGSLTNINLFIQSKLWRALLRLAEDKLIALLRRPLVASAVTLLFKVSAIAEEELNIRLLLRAMTPWIRTLDVRPVALSSPTILLRTAPLARHDEAWRARCPNVVIREIQGTHLTLFHSLHLHTLCEAFTSALDDFPKPPSIWSYTLKGSDRTDPN